MSLMKRALVPIIAAFILTVYYANAEAEVDPNCLGCMCEAATRCNASTECHTPYAGAYFCGPFHISWAYWADAGKPVLQHDVPERQGAFENCAKDLYCAATVVRRYMNNFTQDCDGDGVVTCKDYVRLHKLGRLGCSAALPQDRFFTQFDECARRLNVY